MKVVLQQDETGCGIAVVGTILGISYQQAKDLLFPNRTNRKVSFYTTASQIGAALFPHGLLLADRPIRVKGGKRWLKQLNQVALVKTVSYRGSWAHWTVWDPEHQKILDPMEIPYKQQRIYSVYPIRQNN